MISSIKPSKSRTDTSHIIKHQKQAAYRLFFFKNLSSHLHISKELEACKQIIKNPFQTTFRHVFFLKKKQKTKNPTTLGSIVMRHFPVLSIHHPLSKSGMAEYRCNTAQFALNS